MNEAELVKQGSQLGQIVMLLLQNDFEGARQIALGIPLAFPDGSPHPSTQTAAPAPVVKACNGMPCTLEEHHHAAAPVGEPAPPAGELLPCPFCGSSRFLDNTWTSLGFGVVICSKCEAEGPHTKDNHICDAQAKEAVQLWNTRALPAQPDKGYQAGVRACVEKVRALQDGFTVNITEGRLVANPDGPWFLRPRIIVELKSLIDSAPSEQVIDAERDKLREALRELLASGVELDDPRMGYVLMQVNRDTLDRARALIGE